MARLQEEVVLRDYSLRSLLNITLTVNLTNPTSPQIKSSLPVTHCSITHYTLFQLISAFHYITPQTSSSHNLHRLVVTAQAHAEAQLVSRDKFKCLFVAVARLIVLRVLYRLTLRVPANMHCIALCKRPVVHESIQRRRTVVPAVPVIRNHIGTMASRTCIEVVRVGVHDLLMADTDGDPGGQPDNLDANCLTSK